jgi:2,3-bisphosphoglycerate-dependent phosphoglycerate mutase
MSYLVLVRHGLSEYNKKGLWTGWDNPPLTDEGIQEAKKTGEKLSDVTFDIGYTNVLKLCIDTLTFIKQALIQNFPINQNKALNERNYGDFTAKNKWQVKEKLGDEEFQKLRRGWDYPILNGESLKQVFDREIPYYKEEIEPKLRSGKNVLIVSSGNSLRALIKHIENLSDDKIAEIEFGIGEAYVYNLDIQGKVLSKEIRAKNAMEGKI